MKTSEPGKRGRGNPTMNGTFKKGNDPRRNMAGNLNAALQSYEVRFNNALAQELPPEEFARIVADEVREHRPGAKEFAGKALRLAKESLDVTGGLDHELVVRVVKVEE